MHLKLKIALFLICLSMIGCSLVPNEIRTAQEIMETNPDSALHILQKMQPSQVLTDADRALYGILLFQALDKNNKPLQPDSVISNSINYFRETNDKSHLAMAYFYKARLYKKGQRFDQATLLYLKALDLSQNNNELTLLGKIYSDMGDICLIQKDYKESLLKYQKAIEHFKQSGDTLEACYKIIDVGRVYRFLKEYPKAYRNYNLALSQSNDSLLHGSAYQEIGINFYSAKQYDSAQFFLRKSLDFPYKGTNFAIRCSILADLYLDIDKYDSSFYFANKALSYPTTFFNQRDCYRILANTEYKRGNFKQMADYMTKYQACTDSVRKVEIQTKTTVLEDLHQTSGAFSKSRKFLILLALLIFVITVMSITIVLNLRNRSRKKQLQLEKKGEKLTEKQILLKDGLILKIEETKAMRSEEFKKANHNQRELIIKDIFNQCLHLENWDEFKKLMNKTLNNIVTELQTQCPEINKKELMWCCLFLLKVQTDDLIILLDCQQRTLYMMKHRLTQKLQLSTTTQLEQLLINLSEDK